ncbi:MAG TPA: zinc-dependent metalloprotease [Cyclobacteriaceae bacterium]|nr:zinc-dependent metalloprotease [Cyclobacteriaceae bacterium]
MYTIRIIVCLILLTSSLHSFPQSKKKSKSQDEVVPKKEEKKDEPIKTLDDVVKKCKKFDGLFTVYQDSINGKIYLLVGANQLGKEFIHFSQVMDGPVDVAMRGAYRSSKIFKISRFFDKIEFRLENTSYYFDSSNPISKAKEANINAPLIFSEKIVAVNKSKDQFLIDGEKLFVAESFEQVKPSPRPDDKPGQRFKLGNLTRDKSKIIGVKNYPKNTDVQVELVFDDPYPMNYGSIDITDPRSVNIRIYNSLIEVPENDYQPRFDDPRVGYFIDQITDLTSEKAAPYRDVIHRWHLKKKDPTAALSEPVEPIVWWIENTTPTELRPYIRDGVLQWNLAFEKAGFKNAIVVKEQPDTATWDAGDLRYNVLRWTSSPRPPFGGYGPSFVNPRTGQILGADVMLEYIFILNRIRADKLYNPSAEEDFNDLADDPFHCSLSLYLQQSLIFARTVIKALDLNEEQESKLIQQSIYYLVLHEVGHTLGLNHNMKSSTMLDPVSLQDEKIGLEKGLTGSVMEYPAINFSPDPQKQGLYYTTRPGPYDDWAIEFGYSMSGKNEAEQAQRLKELLNRSEEKILAFGNDADDMRSPGHGIDPNVMINDLSSDPVAYAVDRLKLINGIYPKLKTKFATPGDSYQALSYAYFTLINESETSLNVISRQIGGVYVDRGTVSQTGAGKPFQPVSYQKQKDAMQKLNQYGFSPAAFKAPNELYNMLQLQRRGFNHFSYTEDPKIHQRLLRIHQDLLNQLLHVNTLQRIIDSELYGNQYKLSEFMTDLTDAIFKDDLGKSVNSMRQNLQTEYIMYLTRIMSKNSAYQHVAKAEAFSELNRVKRMMTNAPSPDAATRAHREYLRYLIDEAVLVK